MNKIVLTISGQSGSGKSTMENMLVNKFPEVYGKIISHTTRQQRFNETSGESYHFIEQKELETIEMMETVTFNGNSYGASKDEFDRVFNEGKSPIIVVTPEGTEQIQKKCNEYGWMLQSVFVDASPALLMKRLFARALSDVDSSKDKKKTLESYMIRIENMFAEEATWKNFFDWSQNFYEFDVDTEGGILSEVVQRTETLQSTKHKKYNI